MSNMFECVGEIIYFFVYVVLINCVECLQLAAVVCVLVLSVLIAAASCQGPDPLPVSCQLPGPRPITG